MSLAGCLYCGDENERKTEEHVLQKAFGAELVLKNDVCGRCNTDRFSRLDTALVGYIRNLLLRQHPDVSPNRFLLNEGPPLHYEEETGHWVSVRVDERGNVVTLPQLVIASPTQVGFHMQKEPRAMDLFEEMQRDLANPSDLTLSPLIVMKSPLPGAPDVQSAVVRAGTKKYALRATSAEAAEKLRAVVMTGALGRPTGTSEPQARTINQPMIHGLIAVDFRSQHRSLAKVAMNFAVVVLGSALPRTSPFDRVRSFVLEGTGEGRDLVHMVENPPELLLRLQRPDHHALFLAHGSHGPEVHIVLYQKHIAVVELATANTFVPHSALAFFNYKTRKHEILSTNDPVPLGRALGLLG